MTALALAMLTLAAALFTYRLGRGPSLADRVLALDGLVVCGVAALVVTAVRTHDGIYLPVAVVATGVGFVGTATIARFIEGRGR